jgi:acetoin utilization deacetylase AcuC-like enzyme
MSRRLTDWLARRLPGHRRLPIFYDESYRLPLTHVEATVGIDPRGVDFTTWYLLEAGVVRPQDVHRPEPVSYAELARVHDVVYLESLGHPEGLARIYASDPYDVPVDALLSNLRMVCGGTLGAARLALSQGGAVANMAGGFHHAAPDRGGGFCAVNDIAVALAALRAEGFSGQAGVLDLDAHPPDGTAACLARDGRVWLGSLSGSDWGPVPGVDEVLVPPDCDDATYLRLLEALLARMPRVDFCFVIAGGDVLEGDRFGRVGLSLEGARRRDRTVEAALRGVPSVWLPGGGYHSDSWKVYAGALLTLARRGHQRIKARYDPLSARYRQIAQLLTQETQPEWAPITLEDLEGSLGPAAGHDSRVLGFYTAHSLEHALFRYGILTHLERLGYGRLRVEVAKTGAGDRIMLLGQAAGREHLLIDCVVERRRVGEELFLFVNWLSLRHPLARFSALRPQLPGQEVPGLGLAREAGEMLARMAARLHLAGVAFRPMSYHVAVQSRARFRFADPRRQGRFEALRRDLAHLPLLDVTHAVAEGRVRLNGEPYRWEPDEMVSRLEAMEDAEELAAERERCHFTLDDAALAAGGEEGP